MKSLCILIRHGPYTTIHAAEALRLMNGAVTHGFETTVLLMDDGVYVAKANQDSRSAGWTSLSSTLSMSLEFFRPRGLKVCAYSPSMGSRGLSKDDIVGGVEIVDDAQVAYILARSEIVTPF